MNRWKNRKEPAPRPVKLPALSGAAGGRAGYFITRAVVNIRQNAFVNAVTIGTISLALLIVSLFLLVFVNLENAADNWSERVQVTVYLDHELTGQEQSAFRARVTAIPGTSRIAYVSRDEALKRFKGRLRGQDTLLEGVRPEILPPSFEISLKRASRDTRGVETYVSRLKQVPGISEVQYGEEWVRRFNTFLNFMRMVGALLGIFLIVAVLFIVSNTIKLTIYARRDELEVMSLVGATRFFIKGPFLVEGIIQGGAGALIALLLLLLVYQGFLHNAGNFLTFNPAASGLAFLPVEYIGAIALSGVMLGFVGSFFSLKRFISV